MSTATSACRTVAIVGSANMDLSIPVTRLPRIGETIHGGDMTTNPGGKGANQAVAAQRAADRPGFCRFIGRVGDDVFGRKLRDALDTDSVDTKALLATPGTPSGAAAIMVNSEGDNAIVVSPGANARLTPSDIADAREAIATAAVLAVQLEVPFDTVAAALSLAREAGVLTILDPAPAPRPAAGEALATLPDALWQVDIFSPNQSEAGLLTGIAVEDLASARAAGERLLQFGPKTVVLKLGGLGAAIVTGDGADGADGAGGDGFRFTHIPAIRIPEVVDTTAAGDAFTGALATALAEGRPLPEAVRFAGIAGSLACTVRGAQAAIPRRQDILARL
ncbi:MAG: PfkB family carbohydrate kinase [Opitutaceae bacterium]|jgi:ribokinase|nr:PfkB family carbohydrate kinase [Opitutaceae bacterium]